MGRHRRDRGGGERRHHPAPRTTTPPSGTPDSCCPASNYRPARPHRPPSRAETTAHFATRSAHQAPSSSTSTRGGPRQTRPMRCSAISRRIPRPAGPRTRRARPSTANPERPRLRTATRPPSTSAPHSQPCRENSVSDGCSFRSPASATAPLGCEPMPRCNGSSPDLPARSSRPASRWSRSPRGSRASRPRCRKVSATPLMSTRSSSSSITSRRSAWRTPTARQFALPPWSRSRFGTVPEVPLAEASVRANVGNSDSECDAMSFSIGGKRRDDLANGHDFLIAVGRVLHVRLAERPS